MLSQILKVNVPRLFSRPSTTISPSSARILSDTFVSLRYPGMRRSRRLRSSNSPPPQLDGSEVLPASPEPVANAITDAANVPKNKGGRNRKKQTNLTVVEEV